MLLEASEIVGYQETVAHIARRDQPHEWVRLNVPVYKKPRVDIRKVRLECGLTLRQAADKLEISVTEMSALERGKLKPVNVSAEDIVALLRKQEKLQEAVDGPRYPGSW